MRSEAWQFQLALADICTQQFQDVDGNDDDNDGEHDDKGYDDVDYDYVFSITWPDTVWPPVDL